MWLFFCQRGNRIREGCSVKKTVWYTVFSCKSLALQARPVRYARPQGRSRRRVPSSAPRKNSVKRLSFFVFIPVLQHPTKSTISGLFIYDNSISARMQSNSVILTINFFSGFIIVDYNTSQQHKSDISADREHCGHKIFKAYKT